MAQQNLDFNIAANVKGMEAIATLINRVGALETETKKLASANATLSSSTDAVIRNGTRYNNALDAQSKELRRARQGTQQLGMQINDFATSVSTGASPIQAFNQQLGQIGYAMSEMGGTAGKVGAFLAGPWGAAITIATMGLGFLIEKLWGAKDASKELEKAEQAGKDATLDLLESKAELDRALGLNTGSYLKAKQAAVALAEAELAAADMALISAQARISAAIAERNAIRRLEQPSPTGETGALGAGIMKMLGYGDVAKADQEAAKVETAFKAASAKLNRARAGLADALKPPKVSGSSRSGGSAAKKLKEDLSKINIAEHDGAQQFIADTIRKGEQSWQEYWNDIPEVAASAMSKIVDINTMATASVNTLGEETSKEWRNRYSEIQQSFTSIGNAVANSFQGMLTGAMSWKDGMKGIINAVINELWRLFVVQQIVGLVTGGLNNLFGFGGGGGMGGVAKVKTGGNLKAFANGTVNAPGGMAWVGERGPELVNLPRGSQVIPAHRAQSMGGGGVTINVDARGSADPAAVRAQVQQGIIEAAPSIIAAAEARTVQGLRRPRLGGAIK